MRGPLAAVLLFLLAAGGLLLVLGLSGREDDAPVAGLELLEWDDGREDEFVERATDAHSLVLYEKSPGGVRASARRVAGLLQRVDRAAGEAGVDPDLLEAVVFLESAGLPEARASDDLEGAVGLAQILAGTATDLLGMSVDVEQSERLTAAIARAEAVGRGARARALRARRRAVDERFDPDAALAGAARYLQLAEERFGSEELAVVSYHMGMGNLESALEAYGEDDVSWAQVYFDSSPTHRPRAYRFVYGLGDDSATYLWRVYAARRIMSRYRARSLGARAPGEPARGQEVDLPGDSGLRCARERCSVARGASEVVRALGQGVREIAGSSAPLTLAASAGAELTVRRRYSGPAQAEAFQFMLDRLESLALIRWERAGRTIAVTVLSASRRK